MSVQSGARGILSDERAADREQIVEMLKLFEGFLREFEADGRA